MWRFLLVLLVCAGLAPLIPQFIEARFGEGPQNQNQNHAAFAASGERKHQIVADRRGHYVADVSLNGRMVEMLVDTGATVTALPMSVAEKAGIVLKNSDFKYKINTANGATMGARAMIDRLQIGAISLRNTEAIVLKDDSLGVALLGMTALNSLDRFDISNGTLVLVQ